MFSVHLHLLLHTVVDVDLLLDRLQVLGVETVGGQHGGRLHGVFHALCLRLQLLHQRLKGHEATVTPCQQLGTPLLVNQCCT